MCEEHLEVVAIAQVLEGLGGVLDGEFGDIGT
jgi:hypothetical protein